MLVLAELAGHRAESGWFRTADVSALFEVLRLPLPTNVSEEVRGLVNRGLLVSKGSGAGRRLSLAPLGHRRVLEIIGEIDARELEAQLAVVPGAELGHARHTVLPPSLAPAKWNDGIRQLLERSPFETNVLCMTRFPDKDNPRPDDPVESVIVAAREALAPHGLRIHRADDAIVDEDLWGNVAAYMWACKFGVALAEDRVGEGLNDNLLVEVGSMLLAGRRCAVLKDTTIDAMPTDLIGRIYKPVDFEDVAGVSREVHRWAAADLGLGRCGSCPAD